MVGGQFAASVSEADALLYPSNLVIKTGCPCLCPDKFPSQTFTYLDCALCKALDDCCDNGILAPGPGLLLPLIDDMPDCPCEGIPGVGIIVPLPEEGAVGPRELIILGFMPTPFCTICDPDRLPWLMPGAV